MPKKVPTDGALRNHPRTLPPDSVFLLITMHATRTGPHAPWLGFAFIVLAGACADGSGPASARWTAVSAGAFHTCAIDSAHRAWCWGRNVYGALGDGTTQDQNVPVRVAGGLFFDSITAGYEYSCGLTRTGTAWCWGENFGGQLGDGTATNRLRPVQVNAAPLFRTLSAGEAHTCGMATGGAAWCWGSAVGPEPGNSTPPDVLTPSPVPTAFGTISAGYEIVCALAGDGTPWCWGLLAPGITAAGDSEASSNVPLAPAPPGVSLTTIGAGTKHACGLAADGRAWCWGMNPAGQLGDGTTATNQHPHPVLGGLVFAQLSAHSPAHACALTAGGAAWCWGAGSLGSLGAGAFLSSTVPVAVSGGLTFRTLATGFTHSCGITTVGELYCWGHGGTGQLGNGGLGNVDVPTPIMSQPSRGLP
jgi:alpha-tubulin suppressor-like RCC1 family protein